jgi:hypothetical protein
MRKEIEKKPKPVIAAVIMTLMLLATSALSMTTTDKVVAGKYENNQATSTSNSCLNPLFDSNTFDIAAVIGNCGNTVSQQAEGGEASSPITVQTESPRIEVQAPPPPVEPVESQTCRECFTAFLTNEQIERLREAVSDLTLGEVSTIDELCTLLEEGDPDDLDTSLRAIEGILLHFPAERVDASTVAEIIDCLERVFGLQM